MNGTVPPSATKYVMHTGKTEKNTWEACFAVGYTNTSIQIKIATIMDVFIVSIARFTPVVQKRPNLVVALSTFTKV